MPSKWDADESWVVYRMPIRGSAQGANAVCTRAEWDEMVAAHPGDKVLLRDGIGSEGEAERLARGSSGDPVPRGEQRLTKPASVTAK